MAYGIQFPTPVLSMITRRVSKASQQPHQHGRVQDSALNE